LECNKLGDDLSKRWGAKLAIPYASTIANFLATVQPNKVYSPRELLTPCWIAVFRLKPKASKPQNSIKKGKNRTLMPSKWAFRAI